MNCHFVDDESHIDGRMDLASSWDVPHIANWFYGIISNLFLLLELVVSCVKPNGHSYFTSPDLYFPRAMLENSPHVRSRVENEFYIDGRKDLPTLHMLINSWSTPHTVN